MQLLQGRAKLPFEVRVDHRQRLVEEDRRDIRADEAAAERDLLLHVGGEVARLAVEHAREAEAARDLGDPLRRHRRRHAAVLQGEGEILAHAHGVVDDRELEDLRDVARLRRQVGDVAIVEQDASARRAHEAGDDVEKRRLPATRRSEQRIGAALVPDVVDLLQRVVVRPMRIGSVGVAEMVEGDARHDRPQAARARSAAARRPASSKRKSRAGSR